MKRRVCIFIAASLVAAFCLLGGLRPSVALADGDLPAEAAAARDRLAPGAPSRAIVCDVKTNTVLTTDTEYDGDVQVEKGAKLDLNGLDLTVNGSLILLGTLHVNGGALTVNGDVYIEGGTLVMMETNGTAVVTGDFSTAGADHTGKLTAGKLSVGGDFFQYGHNSGKAFCPSGSFAMEFTSTRSRLVYFESPADSWLYGLKPFTTYKAASNFPIKVNLGAAATLSYPHLSIRGEMNGRALTVTDTADGVVEIVGPLTPGGGTLTVNDSLLVGPAGGITMTNASDKVDVNGGFETRGLCDCRAGVVEIDGNFRQSGPITDSAAHNNSYAGGPDHITKITGANRSIHFDTPGESGFGKLDISGATLASCNAMSLNYNLAGDTALNYANVYYGGNLNGHSLTVSGNLYARSITVNKGLLTVENNLTGAAANCLVMTDPGDRVLVKKDFANRYAMNPLSMTAGTLEIRGNFAQLGDAAAFRASGAHKTKLSGANKTVSFANPGSSYFADVELDGVTFAAGSTLSMNRTLAADAAYAVPRLYYSGNLAGHALSVTGNLHLFGAVNPAGGSIAATGDMALEAGATLTMANAADRLTCGGAFTGSGAAALAAGSVEFKKSFRYTGTSWAATAGNVTTLSGGANMPVLFDNPAQNTFSRVVVAPGTSLSSGSALPIDASGAGDLTLTASQFYLRGNMGGHSLALTGNLTVPAGATLTLGGGTLSVSGSATLDNSLLVMTNAADRMTVGGNFVARGKDETDKLTNGRLYVKGNFTQSKTYSDKSFLASGSHATVFMGAGAQTVAFEKPGESDGSRFAKVYNMNPDIVFSTVYYSSSFVTTSVNLLSLTSPDGAMVPALSPGVASYICVIPAASTSATVNARAFSANATLTMNGTATESLEVTGVPYDGNLPVSIVVKAADGIYEKTYIVKVERLNRDLASIGLSAGSLSPSFAAGTLEYDVLIPASATHLTVTPAAGNPDSTFTIGGQAAASRDYALKPGESVSIPIVVTGQDGVSQQTYTVRVRRDDMLTGLGQSAGTLTPGYYSYVGAYALNLTALQDTVTLTPVKKPGNCDALTIDGVAQDSKEYTLAIGGQCTATITATSSAATFTYTVTIRRAPIISGFGYSPSAGAVLSPAFAATGGSYTLTIPATTVNLNVAPAKGTDCTSLTVANGTETDETAMLTLKPGESRTLAIEAKAGSLTVTFTLTVVKAPIVTNLKMSQGTLAFSPTILNYTVDVPATSDPVYVTPALASSATATINGAAWNPGAPVTVDPAPGKTDTLTVRGDLGAGSVTFTITVRRQMPLAGIALSTGALSPAFSAREAEYIVSLPLTAASVTVTPTAAAGCSFTINGAAAASVTLTPGIGGSADAVIAATGANGVVTRYTVRATRAALLADIDTSTGALSPAFDGGKLNYAVYLPSTTKSVRITPSKSSSCSYFTINGKKVTSIVLSPAPGGAATTTIVAVGSPSSLTQTFKVTAYRISPVTGIKLSTGKLSPAFSMSKTGYAVSLPATKGSVTITPAKGASCASLKIDGAAVASKTLSPKIGCSLKATIAATAVNGKVYTYTVTVSRAPLLKGISLSSGTLSPAFNVTTFGYAVTVPATTSSVKVTPKKASTGVKSMTVNGKRVSSATLSPPIGGSAKAVIALTASDGKTKQTYTVTVNRLPLLTGIAASAGTLSPAFNPAVTSYTVTLPADTASTTLTVAKAASGVKSVTVNAAATLSQAISVQPCGSFTASIVATATNGKTKAVYTVKVVRAPVVAGITVTGGALSPAFSPATTSYTVSVPATVKKVTLKPAWAAACSALTIDGAAVALKEYAPPVGGSVTATITGKTAAGLVRTYTVKIVRAALVTNIRTSSSACPLSPKFSAATLKYTVDAPSTRNSVTINATKAAKGVKSMTMNGRSVRSLTVKRNAAGVSTVTVVATASDKVTKVTYVVTVYWE